MYHVMKHGCPNLYIHLATLASTVTVPDNRLPKYENSGEM